MADTAIVRSIGRFVAECTVKEQHRDESTITAHPVERSAPVSDHAYDNPAMLTLQVGSSAAYAADTDGATLPDLYAELLAIRASKQLLEVQTGKRLYQSMLIKTLAVDTDAATENVLMITIGLQELILVDTASMAMPAMANRANPSTTSGVTNTGTKTLAPYNGNITGPPTP